MTAVLWVLSRDRRVWRGFLAVAMVCLLAGAGAFLYSAEDATPDPVPFEQTTATGVGGEDRQLIEDRGYEIPRVQVFYSQFNFVVGYRGVEHAVHSLRGDGHEQQFGYPIAIHVSDFSDTSVAVTDEGYLETERRTGWIDAEAARYVVGSEAETASGETVVPFGSGEEASAFSDEYGGTVIGWGELQDCSFDVDGAEQVRGQVAERQSSADQRLAELRPLADREGSITVGEDASTIQAAIDSAPRETAIEIPPGTYNETVVVDRPLTIRGEAAHLVGDGDGSVVDIRSDAVAVTGLSISGVGNQTDARDAEAVGDDWDERVESGYGHGDAGIEVTEQTHFYTRNVSIETPANGLLLRDVGQSAVENVSVVGSSEPFDGFMGIIAMRSPTVVQDSEFHAGRDGVYLHRSHDSVIRNNTFTENRFGVHFMYTSDSLIADNDARRQSSAGFTIMTDPARNAVVGNDVRNASNGILPAGTHTYIADNVLVDNGRGLSTGASQSLYEHNLIYGNDLGIRSGSLRPSNLVTENDIVGNEVAANAGVGPLRIWTHDGTGNFWSGERDRVFTRSVSYSPTDPIDSRHGSVEGAATLAASPAVTVLDSVRDTTPGMRQGNVLDTAPLAEPVRPDRLAELEGERDE